MEEYLINLSTINNVKEFVNIVNRYDFEVDLVSGRYSIDAKSIMGIFSLDLAKPLTLKVLSDDCDELIEKINDFIIK